MIVIAPVKEKLTPWGGMMKKAGFALAALMLLVAGQGLEAWADAPAIGKVLLDTTASPAGQNIKPSSGQVSVARSQDAGAPGLVVTIQPGKEGYPGIMVLPEGGAPWNLAAFGHVEARVVNCGAKPATLSLRLDNAGDWKDNPWNAEAITLKPGERGTITTIFGHSFGHQPGYALNPAAVTSLMIFTMKSDAVQSFRIESVLAAGPAGEKPPVDPRSIRVKPEGGVLLGKGVAIDAAKQIEARDGATAVSESETLRVTFAGNKSWQTVKFKPAVGRWDLGDCLEVRVRLRNGGSAALTPRVRVESGSRTDWVAPAQPLAPGASCELTVPFINPVAWQGAPIENNNEKILKNKPGTGNAIASDAVDGVTFAPSGRAGGEVLVVESIRAGLPPAPAVPEWLGKRPPVEGDWVQTFNDDFDGTAVDLTKWNVTGPNYWDKTSHWSKDNVIVGGGVVRLRYEKKKGPHNDDPKEKSTAYASGLLETYGKWTQRYGYFEARMKLPNAPGLWPAFWMMPDRGEQAGPQYKRQDTNNGGMEFDIMEHLTRWGGLRYNVAMHWGGYGKDHRSTGSEHIYVQPDKDGFITAGLLWLPGKAVFYGNGREVARWESPRISNVPSDLMFTLPTGGWDNSRLDDKRLPDEFVIDYARAWQLRTPAK